MDYSKYQLAVFDEWENTKNNIAIQAAPGSGKTLTLLEILKRTPTFKKSIFLAFNRSIAEELKKKVPMGVETSTLHSLGFRTLLRNTNQKYKLNEIKNWILGKKILELKFKDKKKENVYLFIISRLVDLYRLNVCQNRKDMQDIADKYNISTINGEIDDAMKLIDHLEWYNTTDHDKEMLIDFVDMLYLPTRYLEKHEFPKYDNILVDECLPYHMPVLLSDGSSLPIGEIVDNKLPVEVYTYNEETKEQEFCKVINWSKTLNNKKMYKIASHNKRDHSIRNYVVCTYNHKIFTKEKGFIFAEDLKEGMTIQCETRAKKLKNIK